jgi:protein-disulfide isomerase
MMSDQSTPPVPAPPPNPPAAVPASRLATILAVASLTATVGLSLYTRQEVASLRVDQRALMAELNAARGTPLIDIAGASTLGSPDAPITLVEFADYECPYCIRHFTQTMPQLEANYIRTGKVRYVFKDLPIDALHPGSIHAHEAARCASEQGHFWELHTRLFSAPGTHDNASLEARAAEAGLNAEAFRACLASGRTTAAVRKSVAAAGQLGATGTPTFFIAVKDTNPDQVRALRAFAGAQPYAEFVKALDDAAATIRQ